MKLAELQENIATAFLNKGIFKKAIAYFDKAMVNRGEKLFSMNAFELFRLGTNIISILVSLYPPSIKAKRIPTDEENALFNKVFKKGTVLTATNIQRLFFENIALLKKALKYDISKSQLVINIVSASSILFSVSGISFKISKHKRYCIRCSCHCSRKCKILCKENGSNRVEAYGYMAKYL